VSGAGPLNMCWRCFAPATKRLLPLLSRPPPQPSHQDPHTSAQTTHNLRPGRDWPVKPTIHPERSDAPFQSSMSALSSIQYLTTEIPSDR
jgi:hypothetical protein